MNIELKGDNFELSFKYKRFFVKFGGKFFISLFPS